MVLATPFIAYAHTVMEMESQFGDDRRKESLQNGRSDFNGLHGFVIGSRLSTMKNCVSPLLDLTYFLPKRPSRALPFEAVEIYASVFQKNLEEKLPKSIQTFVPKG